MKIKVPEGMLKAALVASGMSDYCKDDKDVVVRAIEASLCWLSENPIVPTYDQKLPSLSYMTNSSSWPPVGTEARRAIRDKKYRDGLSRCLAEWQRRMFLAPEPEVPEEIKDLLSPEVSEHGHAPDGIYRMRRDGEIEEKLIEAYRRGLKAQKESA